jgi:hypothetical protein
MKVCTGGVNATDASDGQNTFLFFDNFNDSSINHIWWQEHCTAPNYISETDRPGWLRLGTINANTDWWTNIHTFPALKFDATLPLTDGFAAGTYLDNFSPGTPSNQGGIGVAEWSNLNNGMKFERIQGLRMKVERIGTGAVGDIACNANYNMRMEFRRDGNWYAVAEWDGTVNWQTVLFLGYGDSRALLASGGSVRSGRQLFLKVSYAFQS